MNVLPVASQQASPSVATSPAPGFRRRWALAMGLYSVAANAGFSNAVWLVYLAAHGYSPFAIGLFEMLFHVAKFLAEAPTGVFADLVGRRASLIVCCALGGVSSLFYLAPGVAWLVAAGFAISGLAYAFRGGAESALVWHLAERSGAPDRAAQFSRFFSRLLLVGLVALALSEASGGFLSGVSPILPFLCGAAASGLGILPLLLLPEVRLAHTERRHPLAHARDGLRAVWRDPALLGLLLLSALSAAIVTTVNFYTQLYFSGIGFTLAAIGLIFAASRVTDAAFTALAPRAIRRLPPRVLLPLFVGAEALGLLAMSTSRPLVGLIGFLALFHCADAVLYPAISTYLNQRSPEAQRAMVLSLDTGLFSAAMIVLFPLFGLGLTRVSYATAYAWAVVALVAGGLLILGATRLLPRLRARRE